MTGEILRTQATSRILRVNIPVERLKDLLKIEGMYELTGTDTNGNGGLILRFRHDETTEDSQ